MKYSRKQERFLYMFLEKNIVASQPLTIKAVFLLSVKNYVDIPILPLNFFGK